MAENKRGQWHEEYHNPDIDRLLVLVDDGIHACPGLDEGSVQRALDAVGEMAVMLQYSEWRINDLLRTIREIRDGMAQGKASQGAYQQGW